MMVRADGHGVVWVGLLGQSGAGSCPNLPQRRSGTGSAARRSAEYQRFFSYVPARSGSLRQIWTIGAASDPSKVILGCLRVAGGAPGATRGEVVSKSATKAPRGGIGGEQKRGISTILFRRSGSVGVFVADLDNRRRRGPAGGGRSPASARSTTSTPARASARRAVADRADTPSDRAGPARAPPRGRLRRPDPRDRHLTRENVC